MTGAAPLITLNTGAKMPMIGLGCAMFGTDLGERAYNMCTTAFKAGYRHIDTAAYYGTEAGVGRAVRDSGIPRSEIFITTKLWCSAHHRVPEALDASLEALGLDYIDLYLMHWPQALNPDEGQPLNTMQGRFATPSESPTFNETWADMEKLLETGKVKAIGISNFSKMNLEKLLKTAKVVPAANQMECHPSLPLHDLKPLCDEQNIRLAAYSPLGQPKPGIGLASCFSDKAIAQAAERTGSSPGTVALSWSVQRGVAVIPKSETPAHIESNLKLVTLTDEEVESISVIHTKTGLHRTLVGDLSFQDGLILGWTTEQLGFPYDHTGYVPQ